MKKVIGLLLISFFISSCGLSYKDGYQRGYFYESLNKYKVALSSDYESGYFNGRQDRNSGKHHKFVPIPTD